MQRMIGPQLHLAEQTYQSKVQDALKRMNWLLDAKTSAKQHYEPLLEGHQLKAGLEELKKSVESKEDLTITQVGRNRSFKDDIDQLAVQFIPCKDLLCVDAKRLPELAEENEKLILLFDDIIKNRSNFKTTKDRDEFIRQRQKLIEFRRQIINGMRLHIDFESQPDYRGKGLLYVFLKKLDKAASAARQPLTGSLKLKNEEELIDDYRLSIVVTKKIEKKEEKDAKEQSTWSGWTSNLFSYNNLFNQFKMAVPEVASTSATSNNNHEMAIAQVHNQFIDHMAKYGDRYDYLFLTYKYGKEKLSKATATTTAVVGNVVAPAKLTATPTTPALSAASQQPKKIENFTMRSFVTELEEFSKKYPHLNYEFNSKKNLDLLYSMLDGYLSYGAFISLSEKAFIEEAVPQVGPKDANDNSEGKVEIEALKKKVSALRIAQQFKVRQDLRDKLDINKQDNFFNKGRQNNAANGKVISDIEAEWKKHGKFAWMSSDNLWLSLEVLDGIADFLEIINIEFLKPSSLSKVVNDSYEYLHGVKEEDKARIKQAVSQFNELINDERRAIAGAMFARIQYALMHNPELKDKLRKGIYDNEPLDDDVLENTIQQLIDIKVVEVKADPKMKGNLKVDSKKNLVTKKKTLTTKMIRDFQKFINQWGAPEQIKQLADIILPSEAVIEEFDLMASLTNDSKKEMQDLDVESDMVMVFRPAEENGFEKFASLHIQKKEDQNDFIEYAKEYYFKHIQQSSEKDKVTQLCEQAFNLYVDNHIRVVLAEKMQFPENTSTLSRNLNLDAAFKLAKFYFLPGRHKFDVNTLCDNAIKILQALRNDITDQSLEKVFGGDKNYEYKKDEFLKDEILVEAVDLHTDSHISDLSECRHKALYQNYVRKIASRRFADFVERADKNAYLQLFYQMFNVIEQQSLLATMSIGSEATMTAISIDKSISGFVNLVPVLSKDSSFNKKLVSGYLDKISEYILANQSIPAIPTDMMGEVERNKASAVLNNLIKEAAIELYLDEAQIVLKGDERKQFYKLFELHYQKLISENPPNLEKAIKFAMAEAKTDYYKNQAQNKMNGFDTVYDSLARKYKPADLAQQDGEFYHGLVSAANDFCTMRHKLVGEVLEGEFPHQKYPELHMQIMTCNSIDELAKALYKALHPEKTSLFTTVLSEIENVLKLAKRSDVSKFYDEYCYRFKDFLPADIVPSSKKMPAKKITAYTKKDVSVTTQRFGKQQVMFTGVDASALTSMQGPKEPAIKPAHPGKSSIKKKK